MRSLLSALITTVAAMVLTFASCFALYLLAIPCGFGLATLFMFAWLVITFHYEQARARGREFRMKPPVAKAEER